MASDEHPKIYQMKLWATNEVRAKSKFWYFLRKLKKVKKSNGQVLAINETMLFCGGEVVPPQLSSWQNPICCQRCEGGCVRGTPSKRPVELETFPKSVLPKKANT
ncbi:uncharacterized protein LOC110766015 isoform X2 [Prunus avium]|uniref:Uncharacterized protein LOC110766015 isoform X2 n=1 Tax=Prunus avium TaxID=42229 RepID=A0A6P5TD39_PRUAV|nr:uncharacterized protein LOC110766015 isoform X2 [Prunus avium]